MNKTEKFIKQLKEVHGNRYDYSKVIYTKVDNKITVICKIHGEFNLTAYSHRSGTNCAKCSDISCKRKRRMSLDTFILKAKQIHGNLFNYSLVKYKGSHSKVTIICPEHGEFKQKPNAHLSGKNGCPICNARKGYLTRKTWKELVKNKLGRLYVLECSSDEELFIKIGITSNTVKRRFIGKNTIPYKYKVIKEIKSKESDFIWDLENKLKEDLKEYSYKPSKYFGGFSECYNINNKELILNKINEYEINDRESCTSKNI